MKPINPILYYTEYFDTNGHKHYAVHKYNPVSRFVTSMRDIKFKMPAEQAY